MSFTLGVPRMHKEPGERRDFLPPLLAAAAKAGATVVMERGVGSGMDLTDDDYLRQVPGLHLVDTQREAWQQDMVLVLRSPDVEEFDTLIKRGSTVIAMLHLHTRPRRVARLQALGCAAASLDGIEDDQGIRLVENTRAVGWNGLEAAFTALETLTPTRLDRDQPVINVTVMGAGQVGKHATEAAIKYGRRERWQAWTARGCPPVRVSVIGRRIVSDERLLQAQLEQTDVLVDATQRDQPERPLIPNAALRWLPKHAVIADLVVDPYVLNATPPTVRSIEGIPMGSLDQYIFAADDPKWSNTVPQGVKSEHRRAVVSCYSWPGIHPRECMEHYGRQLEPFLVRLVERKGAHDIKPDGDAVEYALWKSGLDALD